MEIVWGVCISYYYSCSSNANYEFVYLFIDFFNIKLKLIVFIFQSTVEPFHNSHSGQKKKAVVLRWPLWGGRGAI